MFYGGYTPYWDEHFLPKYGFENLKITPNGGFFKHYGQETARFLTYLFPTASMSSVRRILTLPFKAVFAVYFRVIMPTLCHYLDRFDKDHHFTIGYHVEAKKK